MAKSVKKQKKSAPQKIVKKAVKKVVKSVKKPASKKASSPKKATKPAPSNKPAAKSSSEIYPSSTPKISNPSDLSQKPPKQSATHLSPQFVVDQKKKLVELHDHILDQMQSVAQDNLRSRPEGSEASAFGMHQADAGSDAYDKDFALSLLSQEQDALYEIEEALKRIENGIYGVCEMSSKPIPKNRLEAIPFARFTVECQSQLEKENKGRRRWDTTPQFMDSEESLVDEDDEVVDEEGNRKEKE